MLAVALALPSLASAQEGRPASWRVAYDRADAVDSTLLFATMAPGWHVTAGPAGVLYDPANALSGRFRVESTVFVFSAAPGAGAGVAVGGTALDGAGRAFTVFEVDNGRYRIVRHSGARAEELVGWTAHDSIPTGAGAESPVKNVLAVDAGDAEVRFSVNGADVATLPRERVAPDGVVGLRVEEAANVHVATLLLDGRNAAPEPAPKR
jgi:hypothetical protein